MRKHKSLAERFWAKVDQRGPDECWPWTASCSINGYGQIQAGPKPSRPLVAHRLSWEIHNGPIPDGLNVLHKCDNPPCCNPAHLFLGTQKDNVADMHAKGRAGWAIGEQHGTAKLNPEKVREIRASQLSCRAAAKIFGVSNVTIAAIRRRAQWGHVE